VEAYLASLLVMKKINNITWIPIAKVIKLFQHSCQKVRLIVQGKPFLPSIIFVDVGSLPELSTFLVPSSRTGSRAYPQKLDGTNGQASFVSSSVKQV